MKKLLLLFALLLGSFSIAPVASVSAAYEGAFNDVCDSAQGTKAANSTVCAPQNEENPITKTIGNVVDLVSVVAGAVAVIIIIWAGFQFVIGNGDPAKIAKARQTIIYAVVGLIVIVASNLLISFIVNSL